MGKEHEKIIRLRRAADRCRLRAARAHSPSVETVYLGLADTYENLMISVAAGRWMQLDRDARY